MIESELNHAALEIDTLANSSSMERMLETAFLSELLQETWFGRSEVIDVMHSPVDAFGYDLIVENGTVLRHVQLKARRKAGKAASYAISTKLAERPSGCVIWIGWDVDPETKRLNLEYRWLGGQPGEPLASLSLFKPAKHTKANALGMKLERHGLRKVPLGQFERLAGIGELIDRLFGPASVVQPGGD